MIEFLDWVKENLPTWAVVVLIVMVGVMKYGPKFIKDVISAGDDWKDKSDSLKNEYIAMLKNDKEDLQRKNERLESEIKRILRDRL